MATEKDVVARTGSTPLTTSSLEQDLKALGLASGMTVLVHCSLSSLGWVCGGAVAIIDALERVLGATGTLVMPTHSGELSEPSTWKKPAVPESWWQTIRDTMPAFDSQTTPTRKMGCVAECFRTQAGVIRSNHPQVSFSARGPNAELITDRHSLEFCLGENSPLARLYDLDASVLLLGVGHERNTSIHLAEYRVRSTAERVTLGAPIMVDGERRWATFEDFELDDADFAEIGGDFETSTGHVTVGRIGVGDVRVMPVRRLVDFATDWMNQNRGR